MRSVRTRRTALFAIALVALLRAAPGFAGEIGHYAPGVYNIRDFFVPDPGLYFTVYNVFYTTDTLRDRSGDKVRSVTIGPGGGVTLGLDVDVDSYTLAPTLIGVADWDLPGGGRYGGFISPTFANNSVSAALSSSSGAGLKSDEDQFGVGDLYVQPLWLGWSGDHWDFSLSYGFYAPVGKYDTDKVRFPLLGFTVESPSADNIGLGFWTHQFQTAGAWYPWKHRATAVAMALTGEVHGEKRSIDVTPGSHISWNWGISQFLPLTKDEEVLLEFGPAGYSQWQVSDDSGSAALNRDVHDEVHAAGVQLGLTHAPWMAFLTFKYLHEFGAEDRFEGEMMTLSIGKGF
jgi:hypothetical protein